MNDLEALVLRISALPQPWKRHALERLSKALEDVESSLASSEARKKVG